MNLKHATGTYITRIVADRKAGYEGLELYREAKGTNGCAARLVFWDASGQFALEMFTELPLEVVEELIAEAKQTIKTK